VYPKVGDASPIILGTRLKALLQKYIRMLFIRKWIPLAYGSKDQRQGSKEQGPKGPTLEIYDAGEYIGWMQDSTKWTCWKILERVKKEDGTIQESLQQMPEDWCPLLIASVESYPVLGEEKGSLEIPGWSIKTMPAV